VTGPVRAILLPRPITSPTLCNESYKDELGTKTTSSGDAEVVKASGCVLSKQSLSKL